MKDGFKNHTESVAFSCSAMNVTDVTLGGFAGVVTGAMNYDVAGLSDIFTSGVDVQCFLNNFHSWNPVGSYTFNLNTSTFSKGVDYCEIYKTLAVLEENSTIEMFENYTDQKNKACVEEVANVQHEIENIGRDIKNINQSRSNFTNRFSKIQTSIEKSKDSVRRISENVQTIDNNMLTYKSYLNEAKEKLTGSKSSIIESEVIMIGN